MKSSRNQLYIKDSDSKTVYFNRHLLQEKIQETVERSTIYNDLLSENISYAIEKYLETLQESQEDLKSVQEIDDFVTNLLSDAGYDEVSQHYRQMHGCLSSQKNTQEFRELSHQRIAEVIDFNPLFQSYDNDKLTDLVTESCNRLGMPLVSDSFIIEIANHIISNNLFAAGEQNSHSRNILCCDEVIKFFPASIKAMFSDNVLLTRDVSKIFPQIHIDFSFWLYVELQEKSDPMALFELVFMPGVSDFAAKIGSSLQEIGEFIAEKYPDVQISYLVTVDRLEEVIEEKFAFRGKKKLEFRNELQTLFTVAIQQHCPDNIDIVFYKDNKNYVK